ncbi:hypothetical protein T265_03485 [Opisthorchis viverrini]|uniref:Uncharacterized protein n=1 Tax=Opisthorchis viverrini TaxID=6198 RepID=A0A075A349_OPIVI|nr:hypothetical protein T265_03485 [Opisthorchis viverrini]KER30005.1 hypothetical protein T265_03485 [Opisthorchis viverrini]
MTARFRGQPHPTNLPEPPCAPVVCNRAVTRFRKKLEARLPKWLEREFTDRKVSGSNPTSASRLPLSRLEQHVSIPAPVARQRVTELSKISHSTYTVHSTPYGSKHLGVLRARRLKCLEREFTDRKVRGSNPTSVSRLPLSRLRQPGSIPAPVPPSCDTAVKACYS